MHGPVISSYGIHLVNDFNRMRRDRANTALYEGLVKGYEVVIDGETIQVEQNGESDSR